MISDSLAFGCKNSAYVCILDNITLKFSNTTLMGMCYDIPVDNVKCHRCKSLIITLDPQSLAKNSEIFR
jgi:hypothetical protein